jgi:hypothetical protein
MNTPSPEPHLNPNTLMLGPVFIFTDKAVVPPPKPNLPPKPEDKGEPPPADQPVEDGN